MDPVGPTERSSRMRAALWTRQPLMCDEHLLLTIVQVPSRAPPPFEGPGRGAGPVVAADLGVVQQVPHEPDLGDAEAVDHHELPVEAGVKGLKVRRCGRPGDAKGSKALVAPRFDADQLKTHSQENVIDGKQLHLQVRRGVNKGQQTSRGACSRPAPDRRRR